EVGEMVGELAVLQPQTGITPGGAPDTAHVGCAIEHLDGETLPAQHLRARQARNARTYDRDAVTARHGFRAYPPDTGPGPGGVRSADGRGRAAVRPRAVLER